MSKFLTSFKLEITFQYDVGYFELFVESLDSVSDTLMHESAPSLGQAGAELQENNAACNRNKLFSFLIDQERYRHSISFFLSLSAYEVTACGDVAPLITSAYLDQAVLFLVEIVEVVRLENLVAELSE